jgi:hypothetical protein
VTAPMTVLAGLIGGVVTEDHHIATVAGLVYCSPFGVVKLQRYGRPVVVLGSLQVGVDSLAAAYFRCVEMTA